MGHGRLPKLEDRAECTVAQVHRQSTRDEGLVTEDPLQSENQCKHVRKLPHTEERMT